MHLFVSRFSLFDFLKKLFYSSCKIIQWCFLWECFLTCTDIYCNSGFQDLFFWICCLWFAFLFLEHSCLRIWAQEEICRVSLTGFVRPIQGIFAFNFVWEDLASLKSRRFRWREENKVIIAPIISAWYNVYVLGQGWCGHVLFSCPPAFHP